MTRQRGPLLGLDDARTVMREMRRRREEAGIGTGALARRLRVDPTWVSAREKGSLRISAAEVPLIEQALGVPAGTLLGTAEGAQDTVTAGRREGTGER